jgi:hypothetical protein
VWAVDRPAHSVPDAVSASPWHRVPNLHRSGKSHLDVSKGAVKGAQVPDEELLTNGSNRPFAILSWIPREWPPHRDA